jgi:hypothetical protein
MGIAVAMKNRSLEAEVDALGMPPGRSLVQVFERGIGSGGSFIQVAEDCGVLSPLEACVARDISKLLLGTGVVDGVILLGTEPSICVDRVHRRCRDGESNVTLEYLQALDAVMREEFKSYLVAGTPCIVLADEQQSPEAGAVEVLRWIQSTFKLACRVG